jgi:hypothetical protein
MKYKKLISFDFDKTLFFTPEPETGKEIFLEKTGNNWPHRGWWGKSETLNMDIFDIPLNEWVYNHFLNYSEEFENFIILATGRLKKVEGMLDNVDKILEKNGIDFHEVHLNWGVDTLKFKIKLFEEKIKSLGVEEFIMFDDRSEHLSEFEKWADKQNIKITIIDVINKTEKNFYNI